MGEGEMNKNNFFVKCIYFYKCNLLHIKEDVLDVWEDVIDFLEANKVSIILIPIRIISIFIPIFIIIAALQSEYLNEEAVKTEEERLGIRLSGANCYYDRKQLEKDAEKCHQREAEYKKRQMSMAQQVNEEAGK
jgi:5-bromo-4-chloroindolyl phosphate hydrolysis protein